MINHLLVKKFKVIIEITISMGTNLTNNVWKMKAKLSKVPIN